MIRPCSTHDSTLFDPRFDFVRLYCSFHRPKLPRKLDSVRPFWSNHESNTTARVKQISSWFSTSGLCMIAGILFFLLVFFYPCIKCLQLVVFSAFCLFRPTRLRFLTDELTETIKLVPL